MAMISHELRTPLTGVLSMSEMLEDQIAGPLNNRQAFYVRGIVESGERLLDNAVKFTPEGGRIGLEAYPGVALSTVYLAVWDTGIGIPADQFDHVFHAFTQGDGRLARSHEGIGLGLAYVEEMVRLMGGVLHLKSEPGQGSRFTITLPA